MHLLECEAHIVDIKTDEEKTIVILDQTVFYPQGGGQPADVGRIENETSIFRVEHARYIDGVVEHVGEFEIGSLSVGDKITCYVNEEKRNLHTRLHSAGHLVDLALKKLNIDWTPGKGFHFLDGSYVEYEGTVEPDAKEGVMKSIENMCNELIKENRTTSVAFDEGSTKNGKSMRTVYYGDFGIECGGTHVQQLSDIGEVGIRKIKCKKGVVRLSYMLK